MLSVSPVAVRFRLQELLDSQDPPLSQRQLALRSGVSLVTINGMANNRTRQVSLETLDKVCKALDVEPGELLERTPTKRRRRAG